MAAALIHVRGDDSPTVAQLGYAPPCDLDSSAEKAAALAGAMPQEALPKGTLEGRALAPGASSPSSDSSLDATPPDPGALLSKWRARLASDPELHGIDSPERFEPTLIDLFESPSPNGPRAIETFLEDFTKAVKVYSMNPAAFRELSVQELFEIVEYTRFVEVKRKVQDLPSLRTGLTRSLYIFPDGTVIIQLNKGSEGDIIIGGGSFSKVKLGFDLKHMKFVAISTAVGGGLERTKYGYEAAEQVPGGRGVVSRQYLFDAGSKYPDKGKKWVVIMEYIDGMTLKTQIETRAADKVATARQAEDLCIGLASVHSNGVGHGDVKPQNIVIGKDGRAILIDFGLASDIDSKGHGVRSGGTQPYQAPQQFRKQPDMTHNIHPKHDIFSLGRVLWDLWQNDIKTYLKWGSFTDVWTNMEKEAKIQFPGPAHRQTRREFYAHTGYLIMSKPDWMLKDGMTMTELSHRAAAGDIGAQKAFLIARMCAFNMDERPSAIEAAEYVHDRILEPLKREAAGGGAGPA